MKLLLNIISGEKKLGSYVLMWNMLEEQVTIMETWKNS